MKERGAKNNARVSRAFDQDREVRRWGFGTDGRVYLRGEVTSRHLRGNVQESTGDSRVELQGQTEIEWGES